MYRFESVLVKFIIIFLNLIQPNLFMNHFVWFVLTGYSFKFDLFFLELLFYIMIHSNIQYN